MKLWVMIAVAVVGTLAVGREEFGWYRFELPSGEALTARLIGEEEDFLVLNFQGSVLRMAKSEVVKMERLSAQEDGAPAGKTPPDPGAGVAGGQARAAQPEPALPEDALRDAVEELAVDEAAARAYRQLAAHFDEARPFLHIALRHQNPRVRALSVKLLGEHGTAKEDLAAAAGRLSDDRPAVRLAACMALRALGPEGLADLLDYLKRENVPNNRKMAVTTLKEWKDRRAVAPLVDLLQNEKDEGVRNFTAVALETLTRKKLGKDPSAWSAFLAEEQRRRELERINQSAGLPEREPTGQGAESAKE